MVTAAELSYESLGLDMWGPGVHGGTPCHLRPEGRPPARKVCCQGFGAETS